MRIIGLFLLSVWVIAGERVPGETWMQYSNPQEAGFNAEKLAAAQEQWKSIPSSAFFIVVDGAVLASWGDAERRFMCHSVRKSFMSGLYGIYWDQRKIDLNKTLADLGIDDYPDPLLPSEKQARILDLLKARSGIFHPAAYAGRTDSAERGSKGAGRYFAYNNWDFNTLVEILEQETGDKVFEAFDQYFAQPTQMEDWRVSDGYYHYERDKSRYPAYPFRMSARDAARFGLIYARHGMWGDQKILSHHWTNRSTALYSDDNEVFGYSMLWWVARQPEFEKYKMVTALGVGNQAIAVFPEIDMVIVNRANTYNREGTPTRQLMALIKSILDAREGEPVANPKLAPIPSQKPDSRIRTVSKNELLKYAGTWDFPPKPLGLPSPEKLNIQFSDETLKIDHPSRGTFKIYLQENGTFFVEDQQNYLFPIYNSKGVFTGLGTDDHLAAGSLLAALDKDSKKAEIFLSQVSDESIRMQIFSSLTEYLGKDKKQGEKRLAELGKTNAGQVESTINFIGYQLVQYGRQQAALDIFQLNTRLFPEAFNTWDSLGELELSMGNKDDAKVHYQKSLDLNPQNANAKNVLETLNKE